MRKGKNIFRRKDGRWEARYIKGYEPSGKIMYGYCYGKTYSEAKEKAAKYRAALLEGKPLPQKGGRRLEFYCDEWLNLRKNKIKESTYVKYVTVLEKHIKPKLGCFFPSAVTAELIDSFTNELLSQKLLAVKTVHDILAILHSVLKHASAQLPGRIQPPEISYPKKTHKEIRVLSRNEQGIFTAYLLDNADACKFGILLMLISGMRIGELCALRWDNINVCDKTISVASTMQRLHDTSKEGRNRTRIITDTPKSSNSIRTIPMTDFAAALCRRFDVQNPMAYILTGTEEYMEPRALQYRIRKYTRECGLEGVHAHTLRHSFATRAVEVGFEIKSLSEILGHASTTITLERYVHSSMELKRANMDKLSAIGL